jgi:transaldolase
LEMPASWAMPPARRQRVCSGGSSMALNASDVQQLKIKLYCDGANLDDILSMAKNPLIRGFTTNPTLVRKAGITDYEAFGRKVLAAVPNRPISLEVFADDIDHMESQGRAIAEWGKNVNVKIPVTNTKREFTGSVIQRMSRDGIILNITAIMTLDQVRRVAEALDPNTPAIVSVFAGRIADTGIDPVPLMAKAVDILKDRPKAELLWASPRELLNVFQADAIGCHIITATTDILGKLKLVGKDLDEYSLDTVKMFFNDAQAAGYSIREKVA